MPRPLPVEVVASTGGDPDAVRDHILDAAYRVIARDGLAAATTRAVAEEAGIGAGTLYNYFDDRLQLLARSIFRRVSIVAGPLRDLHAFAGKDTVAANLRQFARRAGRILDELVPLFSAAFSDADLLVALRHEMSSAAAGGPSPGVPIERYLLAERELGRVSPEADCHAAASLIVSLCHDRAFHRHFSGATGRLPPFTREIDFIARAVAAREPARTS